MTLKDDYQELLQLTKLYLLREYSPKEWKVVDEETFQFFKQRAPISPKETKPPAPKIIEEKPSVEAPLPKVVEEKTPVEEPLPKIVDEKPAPKTALDLSDIKQFLESELTVLDEPPSDKGVRRNLPVKKGICDVVILSFDPKPHPLLKNLCLAINQELAPATIIHAMRMEKEKRWEELLKTPHLKLVITADYGLNTLEGLMKYYREVPKQAKTFLANIPLLLLTDISLYLKEPKLKASLWQAICQMRPWNTKNMPRS